MAANASSRRWTTLNDTDWLEIAPRNAARSVFSLQMAASTSACYVFFGLGEPSIANSFLLSALDTMELSNGSILGPVRIKAATGGIASLVLLEG